MDDHRFDALVRSVASGRNRRQLVQGLLGLGSVVVAGRSLDAEAAGRPTPTPKPVKCPGQQTWNGNACVCPEQSTQCGSDCCPDGATCCDNGCCYGECYGEELCCPTGSSVCDGECIPGNLCPCGPNETECGSECCPDGATCCDDGCCDGECDGAGVCCPAGFNVCYGECVAGDCPLCPPYQKELDGICFDRCTSADDCGCSWCAGPEGDSYCVAVYYPDPECPTNGCVKGFACDGTTYCYVPC